MDNGMADIREEKWNKKEEGSMDRIECHGIGDKPKKVRMRKVMIRRSRGYNRQKQPVGDRCNQGVAGWEGKKMKDRIKRKWMNVCGNKRRSVRREKGNCSREHQERAK